MGSFNETCALSGFDIPCNTPIRLLFLTQNPYIRADQHEAQRGVYHTDQWFVRTPPLKGKYADYGKAELEPSPLIKLIADVFSTDVVERPFGFNEYHAHPVFRGKDLDHYITAAWDGRLLVRDDYTKSRIDLPKPWPTWQRVFKLLEEAKLPLQHKENEGYNAQDIIPGVVCVDYNSYENTSELLKNAEVILSEHYDCKLHKGQEAYLIVTVKDAFTNPYLLTDIDKIESALNHNPVHAPDYRELPVLTVMVREDVWQAFCTLRLPSSYSDRGMKQTVVAYKEKLTAAYNKNKEIETKIKGKIGKTGKDLSELWNSLSECRFDQIMFSLPLQTTAGSHLAYASKSSTFDGHDDLLQACAELSRVETVLARTYRSWHIPSLGGQESEWKLRTNLLSKLYAIGKQEQIKEEKEYQ